MMAAAVAPETARAAAPRAAAWAVWTMGPAASMARFARRVPEARCAGPGEHASRGVAAAASTASASVTPGPRTCNAASAARPARPVWAGRSVRAALVLRRLARPATAWVAATPAPASRLGTNLWDSAGWVGPPVQRAARARPAPGEPARTSTRVAAPPIAAAAAPGVAACPCPIRAMASAAPEAWPARAA
jgi:hypothetical protein